MKLAPQTSHQILHIVVGFESGVDGTRTQCQHHGVIVVGTYDERLQILVLVKVTVEKDDLLLEVAGVIDRVDIEGQTLGGMANEAINNPG